MTDKNSELIKLSGNSFIKDHLLELAFLSIYAVLLAVGVSSHEMWRDEAQAWLIAKNLNFVELFGILKSEGHMLPWYLILMPFAKFGAPYSVIPVISSVIVFVAGVILVFKAPFGRIPNCLILLTYPMLYSMSIISRCYALIPLAAVLVAIFHKDRHVKPYKYLLSLVFMANTHLIMWGFVFIFALEFFLEFVVSFSRTKSFSFKKKRESMAMLVALALIAMTVILPLWGGWNSNTDIVDKSGFLPNDSFFSDAHDLSSDHMIALLRFVPVVIFYQLVLVVTLTLGFISTPRYTLMYMFLVFYQLYVHNAIRGMDTQKSSAIIICFIVLFWISKEKMVDKPKIVKTQKVLDLVILIPLLFAVYNSLAIYVQEIKTNFSSAKDCAHAISNSLPENSVILSPNRPEYSSSIIAYMGNTNIKFMNVNNGEEISFAKYDEYFLSYATPEEIKKYAESFPANTPLFLMTMQADFARESALVLEEEGYITEILSVTGSDMEEDYYLYKFNREGF